MRFSLLFFRRPTSRIPTSFVRVVSGCCFPRRHHGKDQRVVAVSPEGTDCRTKLLTRGTTPISRRHLAAAAAVAVVVVVEPIFEPRRRCGFSSLRSPSPPLNEPLRTQQGKTMIVISLTYRNQKKQKPSKQATTSARATPVAARRSVAAAAAAAVGAFFSV